jgi:NADH-quinone oxidoreductase subunit E
MKFTLETVNCLGACALSPLVMVDQKNYGKMTADKIDKIIAEYRKEGEGKSHGKD